VAVTAISFLIVQLTWYSPFSAEYVTGRDERVYLNEIGAAFFLASYLAW